ncbi:hypothetical protein D3C72_1026840 [compost metagenome]
MHHLIKKAILIASLCVSTSAAFADPSETLSQSLERSAQSGLSLETTLNKNTYRQEPYQAEYEIQVPYDVQETYYVDVPYQETETYTDYEEYYESEYQCHNYTEYERRCRNEPYCTIVPGERRCHTERDCDKPAPGVLDSVIGRPNPRPFPPGGGGGGTPRPDPVCHDRQVCDDGPPRRECRDQEVCSQEPVTRQRCGYEQVRRTRPVTRTREVTRYRQEARTRTVTRYRTETRCCETRYKDVFDHQWNVKVQVVFPAGTELQAGELETFKVKLAGDENAPQVRIEAIKSIFGYKVADTKVAKGSVVITLQQVARFAKDEVSKASIQGLQVVADLKGLSFKFNDDAILPRVKSSYQLLVKEVGGGVIAQSPVQAIAARENRGVLAVNWNMSGRYEVVLKLHREGVVIEGGAVDFEISQALTMQVDEAALRNEKNIYNISVTGQTIFFKDDTIAYASVDTTYAVEVARKNILGKNVRLGSKTFSRTGLKKDANGNFVISPRDLGVGSDDMKYLKAGNKVYFYMKITRKLQDGDRIEFSKAIEVRTR